jgi:hypothetical protein
MQLLARVATEPVPPPSRKLPGIQLSVETEALIMRCLAKDPAERFQSANALRDALAAIPRAASSTRAESLRLAIDAPASLELPPQTGIRRSRKRNVWSASLMFGLGMLSAAILWLAAARPHWLHFLRSEPNAAAGGNAGAPGALPLREWVQGIPFPEGTEYAKFEPKFIDARVPADPEPVIAFYRYHLAAKWSGFQALATGIAFEDPAAPIESLTVTPFRHGSRVTIMRR